MEAQTLFSLVLFLLFVAVPAAEIALFVVVGREIGVWATLGLVILTALAGSVLIRHQGMRTLLRAQETLSRREVPVAEAFDGICLVAAGFLLLTPGFFTDSIGLLLLLPPLRSLIRRSILRRMSIHVSGGSDTRPPDDGPIIDGDYQEVRPDGPPKTNGHLPPHGR